MSNEEMEKQLKEAMGLLEEKKEAEAVLIFEALAEQGHEKAQYYLGECYMNGESTERDFKKAFDLFCKSAAQGNKDAQEILKILKKMGVDTNGSGVNKQRKMTFNYLLTHKELPKLFFSSLDHFYETVMPSPEMFQRFFDFALNRAKYFAMESPDKFTEPFTDDDKFKIWLVGETDKTSVIVVGIPRCEEICDSFQVAFTCAKDNPRYFTCELSKNPMTEESCVIVGEWKQRGEGFSHHNYGLLDTASKESFAGRVIKIAYHNKGETLAMLTV
jgi:hypothetical protein